MGLPMDWMEHFFWQDHFWMTCALVSASMVVISGLADRKRHKRVNIEDVGFIPWPMITLLSVLGTVLATALAIKGL
jgi:hypothetical protein